MLSFIFLGLAIVLAQRFPSINTDEIFIAVHGQNLVSGLGARYSLYDDIFARSVYPFRDAFAQVSLQIYNAWVGLCVKLMPPSVLAIRLTSLIPAWLSLLVFYAIGRKLNGPRQGLIMMLCLVVSPSFWVASCVTRPEALLLLLSGLTVYGLLFEWSGTRWGTFGIGLSSGSLLGVHPNGLTLLPGIFLLSIARNKGPRSRKKNVLWLILGMVTGATFILGCTDMSRMSLFRMTMFADLYKPPLLSLWRNPGEILSSFIRSLSTTEASYFAESNSLAWVYSLVVWRTTVISCALAGLFDRSGFKKSWRSGFLLSWASALLASACLMRKHEAIYDLNFYPFLLPAFSGFWAETTFGRHWMNVLKAVMVASVVITAGLFALFLRRCIPRYTPYPMVLRQFQRLIPDKNSKVVAPNIFWPSYNPDRFRDSGALLYSHWYTGGQSAMREWLSTWRPDVLILDTTLLRIYTRGVREESGIERLLEIPVKSLGEIETGPGSYGTMSVYKLIWDVPAH